MDEAAITVITCWVLAAVILLGWAVVRWPRPEEEDEWL